MEHVSSSIFKTYSVLFFAFAIGLIVVVNAGMTQDETVSRNWMILALLVLEPFCLAVYLLTMKRQLKGIHLLCLLWLLLMPFIMYINHAILTDYMQTILWPLIFETTYICCYHRSKRGMAIANEYLLIGAIGLFFFLQTRMVIEKQTNTIYLFFLTLPFFLYRFQKQRTIILVVFTFFALLSLKRSVMLSTVLIWMFCFIENIKRRRNLLYVVATTVFALVMVSQLYDRVDEKLGGMLSERVGQEEVEGEGRSGIYEYTLFMIQSSTPRDLVLGHGHYGVKKDSFYEMSAHNDFLEVIYDYGLIILILYLWLWGYVIRQCYRLYRARSSLFIPYATTLSFFLVMSMVSHLILYATYFNYIVMFWGMTEAILETQQQYIKKLS